MTKGKLFVWSAEYVSPSELEQKLNFFEERGAAIVAVYGLASDLLKAPVTRVVYRSQERIVK